MLLLPALRCSVDFALLPPSGRPRKKGRLSFKTLFHDPDSDEHFAGAGQDQEAVGEPAGHPAARVVSHTVSVQHAFRSALVGDICILALPACVFFFASYTKAHTVACEVIRSRKGIVNYMQHFYTKSFRFVIYYYFFLHSVTWMF